MQNARAVQRCADKWCAAVAAMLNIVARRATRHRVFTRILTTFAAGNYPMRVTARATFERRLGSAAATLAVADYLLFSYSKLLHFYAVIKASAASSAVSPVDVFPSSQRPVQRPFAFSGAEISAMRIFPPRFTPHFSTLVLMCLSLLDVNVESLVGIHFQPAPSS